MIKMWNKSKTTKKSCFPLLNVTWYMGALYVHRVRVFLMNEHAEWMAHVLDIVQKEQGIFLCDLKI